jgi:hypothetical protein
MIKELSASHLEMQIIADAHFSILTRINKISTCLHIDKLSESAMIRERAMIKRFPALRKNLNKALCQIKLL